MKKRILQQWESTVSKYIKKYCIVRKLLIILVLITYSCDQNKNTNKQNKSLPSSFSKDFQSNYDDFIYAIFEKKDLPEVKKARLHIKRPLYLKDDLRKLNQKQEDYILFAQESKNYISVYFKLMAKVQKPRIKLLEQEMAFLKQIHIISNNQQLEQVIRQNIKQFEEHIKLEKQVIDEARKIAFSQKNLSKGKKEQLEYKFVKRKKSLRREIDQLLGRQMKRLYSLVKKTYGKDGNKQGQVIHHYMNGSIEAKYNYKEGFKHGKAIYYDMLGKIKYTENYKNGKLHGTQIYYGENDRITYKSNYKDDLKHGEAIYYYMLGNMESKTNYKDGLKHGAEIGYYKNKAIRYKANYKEGKLHGDSMHYYISGKIKSKGTYNNGKKEGEHIGYHENGEISFIGSYINGIENGEPIYYNEDGEAIKEK